MNMQQQVLTKNKYSRPGVLLKTVKGIVIHWVGNPGTSAQANHTYFENLKNQAPPNDDRYASAHYIIGLHGEVIQCVPDTEFCYHVGANRYTDEALQRLSGYPNNCTLGIELCHPDSSGQFTKATLLSCRELVSFLLAEHKLKNMDVWRHYDITGKICPRYFVENQQPRRRAAGVCCSHKVLVSGPYP
jgi:N-acetylmuramoyl-L-alanine amidase